MPAAPTLLRQGWPLPPGPTDVLIVTKMQDVPPGGCVAMPDGIAGTMPFNPRARRW